MGVSSFSLPILETEIRAWAAVGLSETRGAGGKRPGGVPVGMGDFPASVSWSQGLGNRESAPIPGCTAPRPLPSLPSPPPVPPPLAPAPSLLAPGGGDAAAAAAACPVDSFSLTGES